MELNEAIEILKRILFQRDEINKIEDKEEREIEKSAYFEEMPFDEIDTVLEELNNRIPKKLIKELILDIIKSNPENDDWQENDDYYVTSCQSEILEKLGELIGEEW